MVIVTPMQSSHPLTRSRMPWQSQISMYLGVQKKSSKECLLHLSIISRSNNYPELLHQMSKVACL